MSQSIVKGEVVVILSGVAVIVATFMNPPAFVYIAIGHYLSSLGPLIPRGGHPIASIGLNLLVLVVVGEIHCPSSL